LGRAFLSWKFYEWRPTRVCAPRIGTFFGIAKAGPYGESVEATVLGKHDSEKTPNLLQESMGEIDIF